MYRGVVTNLISQYAYSCLINNTSKDLNVGPLIYVLIIHAWRVPLAWNHFNKLLNMSLLPGTVASVMLSLQGRNVEGNGQY